MGLVKASAEYRAELIAGLKALDKEARRHLRETRSELKRASLAEKKAMRLGDWPQILCERSLVYKLKEQERCWLLSVKSHNKRIAELEELGQ